MLLYATFLSTTRMSNGMSHLQRNIFNYESQTSLQALWCEVVCNLCSSLSCGDRACVHCGDTVGKATPEKNALPVLGVAFGLSYLAQHRHQITNAVPWLLVWLYENSYENHTRYAPQFSDGAHFPSWKLQPLDNYN